MTKGVGKKSKNVGKQTSSISKVSNVKVQVTKSVCDFNKQIQYTYIVGLTDILIPSCSYFQETDLSAVIRPECTNAFIIVFRTVPLISILGFLKTAFPSLDAPTAHCHW